MTIIPPYRPWFHKAPERVSTLEAAARSWLGTPFRANTACPGPDGGVDCVNYIHEVCVAVGVITRQTLPDYTLDHARHSPHSLLLRWLLNATAPGLHLILVPPLGRLIPGDLLAIRTGMLDHHLAIVLMDGQCAHAIEGSGPIIHPFEHESFMNRILYVARIMGSTTTDTPPRQPAAPQPSTLSPEDAS
jgi:cell wall-associated NlpC family hydrolase